MATFAEDIGDDADLDELMTRVRELALGTGGGSVTVAQVSADTAGSDSDLTKVIEAQSQLNEHLRKTLADMVGCLKTLRDDWADAQKCLQREMAQLSAIVRNLQRTPVASAPARRKSTAPAARSRRTVTSRRAGRVRHSTKGGKQRS